MFPWKRKRSLPSANATAPRYVYLNVDPPPSTHPTFLPHSSPPTSTRQLPEDAVNQSSSTHSPSQLRFDAQLHNKLDTNSSHLLSASNSHSNLLHHPSTEQLLQKSSIKRKQSVVSRGTHLIQSFSDEFPHRRYTRTHCTNRVSTSKYTFFTFLPKNLYEQFRSIANFYFLSIVILQLFPVFKFVDPILVATPILIIVVFTGLKDAIEDWRRHIADRKVNDAFCWRLRHSNVKEDKKSGVQILLNFFKLLSSAITSFVLTFPSVILALIKSRGRSGGTDEPHCVPELIELKDYMDPVDISSLDRSRTEFASVSEFGPSSANTPLPVWSRTCWRDIKVGDILIIRNNESIPADVVILSTSEPKSACFVETKNLDGETNLKVKRGINELSYVKTPVDCANIELTIETDPPSAVMYSFNGIATINKNEWNEHEMAEDQKIVPLTLNSVLLRGCVLRNTKWVIGVVVATGAETKLMLNSGKTPSKRSRIDRQMNPQIMLNFMILFALCFICAILGELYTGAFNYIQPPFYFYTPNDPEKKGGSDYQTGQEAVYIFFNCLIIFQNIVPIAIFISVDVAKIFQSFMIHSDEDMEDPETETRAVPRAWNLCDDLGQIEYIFSDKTGTLTCNVMEFRKCSINGIVYGNPSLGDEDKSLEDLTMDESPRQSAVERNEKKMRQVMAQNFDDKFIRKDVPLSFVDPDMHLQIAEGLDPASRAIHRDQATAIIEFFSLLAVCHTVLVDIPDPKSPHVLNYKAQSPDEAALVAAARDNGFTFLKREDDRVFVDIMGTEKIFHVLHVLEFSSDRKRMSVIVRKECSPEIILLTKGADSVIYERLKKDTNETFLRLNTRHLEMFANDGLRTLCLAFRIIPQEEYDSWVVRFEEAQAAMVQREEAIDAASNLIEKDLHLMGATAIEDKLQDGVPECISTLAKAGIKIWVLTGDKMETAINIGFACNLLTRSMILIIIKSAADVSSARKQITDALSMFWSPTGEPLRNESFALIIDGQSLKHAFSPSCKSYLLELACRCKSVLCCRVSPLQKAQVVRLVRKGLSAMCLAIGDGANDVSMIQEADIGVGISGKEGVQAVMASDYSISQFRFLSRLLLVHGKWAYMRIAELCFNYFYKNVVWLFVLFWYQFDSGFSADIIMDFTYGMFFNTVFSLLLNMAMGMLDQDVNDRISLQVPQLYQKGIRQLLYNTERFWFFIFDAVYQSVICYYAAVALFSDAAVDHRGFDGNKDLMGTVLACFCVFTVNIYIGYNNFQWTTITHISLYLTLFLWVGYVFLYASNISSPTFGVAVIMFTQPSFYFSLVLVMIVSMFPKILFKYAQQTYFPNDTDIVQEYQKYVWKEGDVVHLEVEQSPEEGVQKTRLKDKKKKSRLEEFKQQHVQAEEDVMRRASSEPSLIPSTSQSDTPEIIKEGRRSQTTLKLSIPSLPSAKASIRRIKSESVLGSILARITSPTSPSKKTPPLNAANLAFASTPEPPPEPSTSDADTTPRGSKFRQRSSKSTSSQRGSLQEILIQPLSTLSRRTGDFMKSMPRRLRMASLSSSMRSQNQNRPLVFMGTHMEAANTGFAFSHDGGMEEVITPTRTSLRKPSIISQPEGASPQAGSTTRRRKPTTIQEELQGDSPQ